MAGHFRPCAIVALLLVLNACGLASAQSGQIPKIRVDGDLGSPMPAGGGNGWGGNAFKYLQDALVKAEDVLQAPPFPNAVEVLVATTSVSNPYRPDRNAANPAGTGDSNATFRVPAGVTLLGGFEGTDDEARNPIVAPSVLSGMISGGSRSNNVVKADVGLDDGQLVLDGFVVTGGQGLDGVGLRVTETSNLFFVARTQFVGNEGARGGAIEVRGSGGGPVPFVIPKAVIISSVFRDNAVGTSGGAIINTNAEMSIYSSLFDDNRAISTAPNFSRGVGGAITNATAGSGVDPTLLIVNCTFVDNVARSGVPGGTERGRGGAIYQKAGTMNIVNSIFWGNRHNCPDTDCTLSDPDAVARQQIYDETTSQFTDISFSVVEDSVPGDGMTPFGGNVILDVDPLFEDPAAGDFRLQLASMAVDFGDDAAIQDAAFIDRFDFDGDMDFSEPSPELDGRPRKLDTDVDAGAYEQFAGPCVADVNGDLQVDFDDLLSVLNSFGPCPPGPCESDVNGDGQVEFVDIVTVLNNWGPCNTDGSVPPQGIADCIARIGFAHPEKLAACIEAMMLTGNP